jgi:hypothetical protein
MPVANCTDDPVIYSVNIGYIRGNLGPNQYCKHEFQNGSKVLFECDEGSIESGEINDNKDAIAVLVYEGEHKIRILSCSGKCIERRHR